MTSILNCTQIATHKAMHFLTIVVRQLKTKMLNKFAKGSLQRRSVLKLYKHLKTENPQVMMA